MERGNRDILNEGSMLHGTPDPQGKDLPLPYLPQAH